MHRHLQILLLTAFISWSEGVHKIEKSDDYDLNHKPAVKPLLVNASLNLRNIIGISEREQTISLEMTLRIYDEDIGRLDGRLGIVTVTLPKDGHQDATVFPITKGKAWE